MNIDPTLLHGAWLHSHEEDKPELTVFRPAGYPLPPARDRFGYTFEADGRLLKIGPGATDRTAQAPGSWQADPNGHVRIQIPGQPEEVFQVEALEPDRLVVRKPPTR